MQADEIYAHAMGIKLDEPIPEPQARDQPSRDGEWRHTAYLWRDTAYAWKAQSDTWELRCLDAQASAEKAEAEARKADQDAFAARCVVGVLAAVALAAVIWGATR